MTTAVTTASVTEYDATTVSTLLRDGRARLIDVREPDEHRRERIAAATLVPVSVFDPARVPESDESVATILHCRSGKRSFDAARRLLAAGHDSAAHMKGGIEAWKQAGLPVIVDRKAPMPVMQQTQIAIGSFVLISVIAAWLWSPWAILLAAFMGAGLVVAGATGTCGMASLISKMPWNRSA